MRVGKSLADRDLIAPSLRSLWVDQDSFLTILPRNRGYFVGACA